MAAPAAHAPGLRVVSLLPSATDTLVALGLAQLLVGRTHECEGAAHAAVCTESKLGEVGELSARDVDSAASASTSALWLAALDGDVDTNELSSLEWGA
jgi:iron complex transport system substrate-binding protein